MATVLVPTAERADEIEAKTVVDASIDGTGHLIITRFDGSTLDAGLVKGDTGAAGVSGAVSVASLAAVPSGTPAGTPIFLTA